MTGHDYDVEPERYELTEGRRYHFDLDRRDFLRTAGILGGGLVVAVARARGEAAQESGAAGRGAASSDISAWLHIDENGRITVYTGKVEIGQNIRTSLAQAVADELHVPVDSISLVMADTGLTPYDAGTFGSQTTPRMAPQLARAAATAREMLIERAASAWKVDRSTLKAADGKITAPDGRSSGYGELTRGQQLSGTVSADAAVADPAQWSVRGKVVPKVNGRLFVTGRHQFASDMTRPGMLYGRVLRPDRIGATLASLDDSAAKQMSGVTIVRDGHFVGIAAPTERAAERALAAIRATWRLEADQPSSDTIYEHLKRTRGTGGGRGSTPYVRGDVERAKASGARVFEASYRIPYIAHVPLEPRAALAEWEGDRLTVWTGTQRPFGVRAELASAFRIPEERVRVIVPDLGSAYGGKHSGEAAIEAARLARAAGKPVKLVWTRAEEFSWAYFRPAGVIEVKAAVDAGGSLVSWEFDNYNSGASAIRSPYEIPNQRIAFHPSRSPLRQGSYRGLAATANHYVREMHMDAIARALGVDAVEFRLRHLKNERLRAVLDAAAKAAGWTARPRSGDRALGIACGTEKGSYVATAAELSRASDGFRVDRLTVAFECGAIVNPDGLKNQVEGAVVQGLGGALFEAVKFRDGILQNGTMAQYRVPRFRDIPPIEIVLLDRRDLPSAGAGETPIVCVAPAIGSAARAFGRVATALPVTLERT